jgi:RNA polymerase sigma-70 factor (ECF subfamily)
MCDPADDPEVAVRKKERSEILRRCWSNLSPEHREIIDLVYYQEKRQGRIGIPGNTVKTRMFYTRKRLSELLRCADLIEPDHRDDASLCALTRRSGSQSKTS